MGSVKHRIGLGGYVPEGKGGNKINKSRPVSVVEIITADRTDITADSTKLTADASYPFTADSTRFSADGTIF